jgi:hypothetical protein
MVSAFMLIYFMFFNHLKTADDQNYVYSFSFYFAENTVLVYYKDQPVNAV